MPRTRSSRVLWLLAELDAPCELVKLAPEQRTSAEHRARHPLGRVPALELDDGTVMFESAAICLQLADLDPEASLIAPVGSPERALVYQWVLFAMTELEAPLFRWIRETAGKLGRSPVARALRPGRRCPPDSARRSRLAARRSLHRRRCDVRQCARWRPLTGIADRMAWACRPTSSAASRVPRSSKPPRSQTNLGARAPHQFMANRPPAAAHSQSEAFLHHWLLTVTDAVAATREFGRTRSCVAATLAPDRDAPYVAIAMARCSGSPEVKAIARAVEPGRPTRRFGHPRLSEPHDSYQLRAVTPADDELRG